MLILAVKECRVFSRDAARVAIAFHPLVATEFAIGAHQSPQSAQYDTLGQVLKGAAMLPF